MRDFLEAPPAVPVGSSAAEIATLLQETMGSLLADIRRELQKQNPDVFCFTVVNNTAHNQIINTNAHRITFEINGKKVPIYRLLAFSTYDQNVRLTIPSMANKYDGMLFTATSGPIQLPLYIDTMHVQADALSASSLYVNGPADSTHGGFFIYGWTISDYDRERQ